MEPLLFNAIRNAGGVDIEVEITFTYKNAQGHQFSQSVTLPETMIPERKLWDLHQTIQECIKSLK